MPKLYVVAVRAPSEAWRVVNHFTQLRSAIESFASCWALVAQPGTRDSAVELLDVDGSQLAFLRHPEREK